MKNIIRVIAALCSFALLGSAARADPAPVVIRAGAFLHVSSIAMSPDGRTVGVNDRHGRTIFIDAATGMPVKMVAGRRSYAIRFSPDGKLYAYMWASSIYVHKTSTDSLVLTRDLTDPGHLERYATRFVFSPDSRQVAVNGPGLPITIYSIATGAAPAHMDPSTADLPFAYAGPALLVCQPPGKNPPIFINAATGATVPAPAAVANEATLVAASDAGNRLVFSPDPALWIIHGPAASFVVWDAISGKTTAIQPPRPVTEITMSPDGATVEGQYTRLGGVGVWNAATGNLEATGSPPWQYGPVAVSPDGSMLVGTVGDGDLVAWSPSGGSGIWRLPALPAPVTALAFSPDGATLYTVHGSGEVIAWDVATMKPRHWACFPGFWMTALALSPDGKSLAVADGQVFPGRDNASEDPTGDGECDIRTFDTTAWTATQTINVTAPIDNYHPPSVPKWLAYSPDGRILASSTIWAVTVRDTTNWSLLFATDPKVETRGGPVCFAPNGKILLAARGPYAYFDVPGFSMHSNHVSTPTACYVVSPDSKSLILGTTDGRVGTIAVDHLLDWTAGFDETHNVYPGVFSKDAAEGVITAIGLSADGGKIVAGGDDGVLRFYNTSDLSLISSSPTNGLTISAIDYRRDGSLVATGSIDGAIRIWKAATGALLDTAVVEPSTRDASGEFDLNWLVYTPLGVASGGAAALSTAYALHNGAPAPIGQAGYKTVAVTVQPDDPAGPGHSK